MKQVKRTDSAFFTKEQRAILVAGLKEIPEIEIERFLITCERTGLDPFSRQIYGRPQNVKVRKPGAKKGDKDEWGWAKTLVIITSIDGLRSIAERSGEYRGQTPPEWHYLPTGASTPGWYDVCPIMRDGKGNPITQIDACRVGVKRKDFDAPVFGVANFDSFAVWEKGQDEKYYLGTFWKKMPEHMIAKVAEAQALRKAFPVLTDGLYIAEEIRDEDDEVVVPPGREAAASAPLPTDMKYVEGHGPNITAKSAGAASKPPEPKSQSTKQTETKQPQPEPKAQPAPTDEEKSPFGEDETEPASTASEQDWKNHTIEYITVAKYHRKRLGELTPEDIAKLKSSWVDKFADKIKQNPEKQKEADAITVAYNATK